jgi:hypothetical protein
MTIERDPKWLPEVGDVFKTVTAKGVTLYRIVVGLRGRGRCPVVTYIRGVEVGKGPAKEVPFSTWRAYVRGAEYVKQEEVSDELRSPRS